MNLIFNNIKKGAKGVRIREARVFWSLVALIVVGIALYGYYLNSAVNAVLRSEHARKEQNILLASINEYEFSYASAKNAITLARAYDMDFVDAPEPLYVSVSSSDFALSYGDAESI